MKIRFKTTIMKPIEFHTSINYNFETKEWLQNDFMGSKLVAKENWATGEYLKKYPVLRDSQRHLKLNPV